ncbi:MAG: DUF4823 domain-containing protein [Betaproteobacteria bacterium]|nr:DUF4823 domain-containing protein [Betaproteobacteria bacterium]
MNKPLPALALAIGLAGCTALPVATVQPIAAGADFSTRQDTVVCVLVPPDASFEGKPYPGSGGEVAEKIRDALRKFVKFSRLVSQEQANALAVCREKEATLALETTILHYEDHITGWTGKPDRIELKLFLYKIDQPDQRRSIFYEAKSHTTYSIFLEWGNAKPAALLGEDFEYSIRKLLR